MAEEKVQSTAQPVGQPAAAQAAGPKPPLAIARSLFDFEKKSVGLLWPGPVVGQRVARREEMQLDFKQGDLLFITGKPDSGWWVTALKHE